ncbi:MAG: rhomboid family intramembrane serine protease [Sedimentisphaerales bacterium]|nr:rhomboid family intramembrane serine protease [Sedimentisphaerales bacterium]
MGLYDRDYTRENFQHGFRNAPQMRMSFPQMTPMVKRLLIINVAVFFLQILGADRFLVSSFSVYPISASAVLQLWRYVTYQFLHRHLLHILFNMLGLFFLGPVLERYWGSRKFLIFYLGCGVAGGLLYPVLVWLNVIKTPLPLIGASGAILGMLAACAILFPQFVVIIVVFPVPIRIAAVICIFIATAMILKGANAGGQAAHLGGMAAGAAYVFSRKWREYLKTKFQMGLRQKKNTQQQSLQFELDRILHKVHNQGLQSLSSKERRTLKKATRAEQEKL